MFAKFREQSKVCGISYVKLHKHFLQSLSRCFKNKIFWKNKIELKSQRNKLTTVLKNHGRQNKIYDSKI